MQLTSSFYLVSKLLWRIVRAGRPRAFNFVFCAAAVLLVNQLIFVQAADCQDEPVSQGVELEPLEHLNEAFHVLYAGARDEILLTAGPIFVIEGPNLVVVNDGSRREFNFRPDKYDVLKTVAHTPLAIYVCLLPQLGDDLSAAVVKRLLGYQQLIESARARIDGYGLSGDVLDRQKLVLDKSAEFTDRVARQKAVSKEELTGFVSGLRKQIGANVWEATEMELTGLNEAVQKVKSSMSSADWSKVHVVIMGSPMARKKARFVQYFNDLLEPSETVPRVIYHEGSSHEADALNHVATFILDGHIGKDFFADPVRMYSDLLGPDAARYLKEHPLKN